jgi:hypothetical protein
LLLPQAESEHDDSVLPLHELVRRERTTKEHSRAYRIEKSIRHETNPPYRRLPPAVVVKRIRLDERHVCE